ncbi:unnamed protein product [Ixodes pacificus]
MRNTLRLFPHRNATEGNVSVVRWRRPSQVSVTPKCRRRVSGVRQWEELDDLGPLLERPGPVLLDIGRTGLPVPLLEWREPGGSVVGLYVALRLAGDAQLQVQELGPAQLELGENIPVPTEQHAPSVDRTRT